MKTLVDEPTIFDDNIVRQEAVEAFLKGLQLASETFVKDPLGVPMISSWSQVAAAVPDVFQRITEAVEADHQWDPKKEST